MTRLTNGQVFIVTCSLTPAGASLLTYSDHVFSNESRIIDAACASVVTFPQHFLYFVFNRFSWKLHKLLLGRSAGRLSLTNALSQLWYQVTDEQYRFYFVSSYPLLSCFLQN